MPTCPARSSPMRVAIAAIAVLWAASQAYASREPDSPFFPTPQPAVDKMLEMAELKDGDVLIDLGSGDGRIPITAAERYGIRAKGIEIDPSLVLVSNEEAKRARVADKVVFKQEDLFETDFSKATVITLFLLPSMLERLLPEFLKLEPGTRIVSYTYALGSWKPDRSELVDGRWIRLWVVPEEPPELAEFAPSEAQAE